MTIYKARVYYSDTDASSIAYHARYLDWGEHARTEMLREAIPDFSQEKVKKDGFFFVVKSIFIEYFKAARLDDVIRVESSINELGAFSGVIAQRVFNDNTDELLAELKVKVGFLNGATFRPTKIPEEVGKALSSL